MGKLTFKEAYESNLPYYEVSTSGAIRSRKSFNAPENGIKDKTAIHLTENGTIDKLWGYALFANAEDAAKVAKKIVTTKYDNSIKKIKEVTNF